jgi:hypothetical protein
MYWSMEGFYTYNNLVAMLRHRDVAPARLALLRHGRPGREQVGDARYMTSVDGRNRYNGEGRDSGKGVVYISSERVGDLLVGGRHRRERDGGEGGDLSQAGSIHCPLPRVRSVKQQGRELEETMVSGVECANLRCAGRRKGCSDRG